MRTIRIVFSTDLVNIESAVISNPKVTVCRPHNNFTETSLIVYDPALWRRLLSARNEGWPCAPKLQRAVLQSWAFGFLNSQEMSGKPDFLRVTCKLIYLKLNKSIHGQQKE